MKNKLLAIRRLRKIILFGNLLMIIGIAQLQAETLQQKTVSGKVTDQTGEPLIGVNVVVQGTTVGTITNVDGKFSIAKAPQAGTLVFKYMGYASVSKTISSSNVVNVVLMEDQKKLSEVVVVGFGQQKKINLTGAVSTVDSKRLVNAGVANITTALVGNSPGVSGLQASGEAGRSATSIFIRGRSTFNVGGSDPLIVIDGVEQPTEQAYSQINSMDANEIASVSVLKDASSTAVYGIRGANGVIIVSTKKGVAGKPTINFSANYGSTHPTNVIKGLNSYDWATMRNEAISFNRDQLNDNAFNQYVFSADDLWKFKNGRDYTDTEINAMTQLSDAQKASLKSSAPIWYGSHDYISQMFNNSAPQTQYNMNISGGTEKMKFFTSVGYFYQGSILGNAQFENINAKSTYGRYNFRSNLEFHPTKNLDITVSIAGQFNNTTGSSGTNSATPNPTLDMNARYKVMFGTVMAANPATLPYLIDGHLIKTWGGASGTPSNPLGSVLGGTMNYNPTTMLLEAGQTYLYNTLLSNTIKIVHRLDYITKGLSVRATLNYDDNFQKAVFQDQNFSEYFVTRDLVDPNKLVYYGGGVGPISLVTNTNASTWNKTYFDAGIDYDKAIGNHHFTLLALGKASTYNLPGGVFNVPSGIMGLVGRATYNYSDKYLAEFSMGYNGTEQFASNNRFGFFPAFSLGWVISNEKFLKKPEWLEFLKIRGSYGLVGNDFLNGRRYLYLPNTYVGGFGYNFGNSNGTTTNPSFAATQEGAVGNPLVTWEKSTKQGAGVDAKFLAGRLSVTLDYFKEDRTNILVPSTLIPLTYGVIGNNIPPVNSGVTTNHGYEISLGWDDRIGDLKYLVSGSLSYARNKTVFKAEAPNPYPWMNQTGFSIGQYMGLKSDGFFNTPEELANRPYNFYSSNKEVLGDIKYTDINGDGIIDYKDVVPIGRNNLPEYTYNFKVGFSYKGFDISTLFIGTMNGNYMLNNNYIQDFGGIGGSAFEYQFQDRWTPEKVANGTPILFPRPQIEYSNMPNYIVSDFWLRSTDFFRLKNLEIGYTFPPQLIKKIGINALRVYANGNNLWTNKTQLDKYGIDPETTDNSSGYLFPLTRAFVMGLNVTF